MNDLDLGDVLSVRLAGGKVERRSGIACGPLSPKQGILSGTSLHALERMAVNGPESAGNPSDQEPNALSTTVSMTGREVVIGPKRESHFFMPISRPARRRTKPDPGETSGPVESAAVAPVR